MASVEVLVYLSQDEQKVRRCVKSLLSSTPNTCAITFIGERLPQLLVQYVSQFCCKSKYSNINFTNFTTSLGYNDRMLKVLQGTKTSYVILINDDVVVSGGWISKMLACLNSEPCLGIICPFINGGIRHGLSIPITPGSSLAERLDRKSKREYPRITSADACLLIKRAVLNKIDFSTFKVQAHLEPELCHEARRHGFNIAIADDLFIFYDNPNRAPLIHDDEKFYKNDPLVRFRQLATRQRGEKKKIAVSKIDKSIKIFSPSDKDPLHARWWGDFWARENLYEAFTKEGWTTSQDKADVSLLLKGSENFPSDAITKMVWIYSHPGASENRMFLTGFNHVYTLSHKHAEKLREIRSDVKVLLPATSKTYKKSQLTEKPYDIVIVGNAAKAYRVEMVKKLIATGKYRIGIVGSAWERHVSSSYIIAPYWENEKYAELFDQATLTIYTHAEDMQAMDFVAFRVLDTIACSDCFVICDQNHGLEMLGLGDIPQFINFEELKQHVDYYLEHPQECAEKMEKWRRIIRRYHTFDHRIMQITNDIRGIAQSVVSSYSSSKKSVAVYLSLIHHLCYDLNIKFSRGMVEAFQELGFDCVLVHDVHTLETEQFDIVFCAAPSYQEDFKHSPNTTYIMYQSEQCPREDVYCERANNFWTEIVSKELPKHNVIFDPFEDHITSFKKMGYNNVFQFRVGYHPSFDLRYPDEDRYDVMFIGHPIGEKFRRRYNLQRLDKYLGDKGVRFFFSKGNNMVGEEYQKALFSTKISLNIHYTHLRYFEYHKLIVDSFCNRRFVISEEISHLSPFIGGEHLVICNANQFEDQIMYYLGHEEERRRIANNAYNFVKTHFTLVDNLKRSLMRANLL